MRFSRGGYQRPVTPEDGYRRRLAPKCLVITIANGQSSTDSLITHGSAKLRRNSGAPRGDPVPKLTRSYRGENTEEPYAIARAGADGRREAHRRNVYSALG